MEKEENKNKEKQLPQNATWLQRTVFGAETDTQKLEAMDTICGRVKRDKLLGWLPQLVFKVLLVFGIIGSFWGVAFTFPDVEEMAIIDRLPGIVKGILNIPGGVFRFFEGLIFGVFDKTGSVSVETVLKFAIISVSIAAVIMIFVLPPLFSRVIRFMIKKIPVKNKKTVSSKFDSPKEAARYTYGVLLERPGTFRSKKLYRTWLCSLISALVIVFLVVFVNTMAFLQIDVKRFLMKSVFGVLGSFVIFQLLSIIPKLIARAGIDRTLTISFDDLGHFEEFWMEFDSEKAQEVRKAREAEKRRRLEAERRRAAEIASARNTSSSSAYSASSSSTGTATIVFDTTGISSANNLNVYVDGSKQTSFWGGVMKKVSIPAGYHKVQVQVYNDASETAYTLDPMIENWEAGCEYTVDYS